MENTEKSGQIFIAYKGQEYEKDDIYSALYRICPTNYAVKRISDNNLIFAKIVYNSYTEDRDPHYNSRTGILSVNGYNQNEVERACRKFLKYGIAVSDRYQRITNCLYADSRENMFKELSQYMHFCSVIYDSNSKDIIAGVTEPNSKYTHLYYGYTKRDREIMFSNDASILLQFCDEVHEMDKNTYMKNGELFTLDGVKVEQDNEPELINKSKQNTDSIIEGLNALLIRIADEVIRTKIEKNIDENLTVGEMAKFCGWSDSHFMRWFKKMTGLSLIAYVNERRLAVAAEALKKTDDKILNISQDAGFTNLSNFNRQFRKRYGVTPKEYREMNDISQRIGAGK